MRISFIGAFAVTIIVIVAITVTVAVTVNITGAVKIANIIRVINNNIFIPSDSKKNNTLLID